MNPQYSIIVPLYNKAPYIRKALESVLAQSYRDFELIVVDDGSTDGSADVVRDFVRNDGMSREKLLNEALTLNDGRLKILEQENNGVAAARNNGVKASLGEYICFLDADDWWEPEFLEEMDKLIGEYPEAGLYATNYVYYKPGKTHVALNLPRGIMNYPEAYLHSKQMPVTSITTCMPRKVFDEMGGFPVGIKLGEDFLLWAKTALHYPIAYCEKPLAYYNNDIPASMRATRNLHAPEHHMLFNLQGIENELKAKNQEQRMEWKALLDKLRVCGLLSYWLSDEYHSATEEELKKVDWNRIPRKMKKQYETSIQIIKVKQLMMHLGSYCKQRLLRLIR